jgi:hypothetical protein
LMDKERILDKPAGPTKLRPKSYSDLFECGDQVKVICNHVTARNGSRKIVRPENGFR